MSLPPISLLLPLTSQHWPTSSVAAQLPPPNLLTKMATYRQLMTGQTDKTGHLTSTVRQAIPALPQLTRMVKLQLSKLTQELTVSTRLHKTDINYYLLTVPPQQTMD